MTKKKWLTKNQSRVAAKCGVTILTPDSRTEAKWYALGGFG